MTGQFGGRSPPECCVAAYSLARVAERACLGRDLQCKNVIPFLTVMHLCLSTSAPPPNPFPFLFVFYMHDLNLGRDSHQRKDATCKRNKQGPFNPFSRLVVLAFQLGGRGGKRFTAHGMIINITMICQSNTTNLYYVYYCTTATCFDSYRIIFRPF